MAGEKKVKDLELTAEKCRRNVLRMVEAGGHGHIGGAFSAIDIITALYFYKMHVQPDNPKWMDRDRFILSAGHKCMAQYGVLAERGYFPKSVLDTYGMLKSKIPGHPDMHKLPGIEANTGALGHGLAIAEGMALALRSEKKDAMVYVMLGDGELAEGSNWEAAAVAAQYCLDNLVLFLDNNGLQISGSVESVMNFMPASEKFKAFGWNVMELDGNNMEEIVSVLDLMPVCKRKPTVVICHTVKGKGISFLENQVSCHFWTPDKDKLELAIEEVEARIKELERKPEV